MADEHHLSTQLNDWALSHGVKINGTAAHKFPGKGLGLIATRRLKAGEVILEIPMSLIKTEYSLPKSIRKAIPPETCSVNGLLALELALDDSDTNSLWRSTLPAWTDFKSSMPLFWPTQTQDLLPPQGHALLLKQQRKLQSDWLAVSPAFPQLALEQYTYAWLLVSTRTFYYTPPNLPEDETPTADECLAIVPFGDYFNHSSESSRGCKVNYSPTGYEFIIPDDTAVENGEELFISYGSHSNEFLLVEYGFQLHDNAHNDLNLDEVILPLFSPEQRKLLKDANYLGEYVLNVDAETAYELVCYRTSTALRLLCMPFRKWKRGLTSGFDDADSYQDRVMELVRDALMAYTKLVEERVARISNLSAEFVSQRHVLMIRWRQILKRLNVALDRLIVVSAESHAV